MLIVEWYFKCNYDGKADGFDSATIADFDNDMKILKLCEFQSKAEHCYPYELWCEFQFSELTTRQKTESLAA